MPKNKSLISDVIVELRVYATPPRTMMSSLVVNSFISALFFLGSYWLGSYNAAFLPIASATILLWTLADASVCNQLMFDRVRARAALEKEGTLQRFLLVKNIAVAVLAIPLTVLYGLLIVAMVGNWSAILYGVVAAMTLIWGWLGISNALSAYLPFDVLSIKGYVQNRSIWISYGFLYGLPWIVLPAYALLMGLPFTLLGWTKATAAADHRFLALFIMLLCSVVIWILGLRVANSYTTRPNNRLKKFL